jgi:hypothetical protein
MKTAEEMYDFANGRGFISPHCIDDEMSKEIKKETGIKLFSYLKKIIDSQCGQDNIKFSFLTFLERKIKTNLDKSFLRGDAAFCFTNDKMFFAWMDDGMKENGWYIPLNDFINDPKFVSKKVNKSEYDIVFDTPNDIIIAQFLGEDADAETARDKTFVALNEFLESVRNNNKTT